MTQKALDDLKSFDYQKDTLAHFKELLQAGLSPNTPDDNNETPLIKAIYAHNTDIVKYLISQKADMYATDVAGRTSMMICAQKGYLDIAQILLQAGYNLNRPVPSSHQSALSLAIWAKKTKMVRWLLDNGADVNSADSQGWTPLMVAAYIGSEELVKELLNRHANADMKNIQGLTALDWAVFCHHPKIITWLKK